LIAEAAGVSELTLFRHFGTKAALFSAVVDRYAFAPDRIGLPPTPTEDCYADLIALGQYLYRVLYERRQAMRMMICEAEHFEDLRIALGQVPRNLRGMIAAFFQVHIARGAFKAGHPDVMAQAFLGFFYSYVLGQVVFDDAMLIDLDDELLVTTFADQFLHGVAQTRAGRNDG
jgi:AcrR family transcriptional regulator